MDTLNKKTLQVSRGFTYTYYTSAAKDGRPTLLLCHGFPDEAALWSDLITSHLAPGGYGVIAPDCLGYAGTSKPTDPKAYAMDKMAADQIEILDAEHVSKVVSVGHDWGSRLAQRVYLFHPDRVEAMCLMNVAYRSPGPPLDLDQMRDMLEGALGYFPFWYWYFFCSEDGPMIMRTHLERMFDACHVAGNGWMETLCKKDGLKEYVLGSQQTEVRKYVKPEMRKKFVERFQRDGLEAPTCWYKAMVQNLSHEVEMQIPQDRYVVNVPLLFVGGKDDVVCRTEDAYNVQKEGLTPDLTVHELDANHWIMLAQPKELGEVVIKWLEKISV